MVTINEIRNLTDRQRDEIRDALKPRIYDYLYTIGWAENPHRNFSCPICGAGTRTPNTSIDPKTYRIKSWSCHCLDGADLFDVIEMNEPSVKNDTFEALAFACNLYGYSVSAGTMIDTAATIRPRRTVPQSELERPVPPSPEWQRGAKDFVKGCEATLWQPAGKQALEYLVDQRKLTEKTLRHFHIGYNPRSYYYDGEWKAPAGIVIPTFIGDDLYRVKVRRDDGKPKYQNYTGSVNCCPFNEYDLLHEVDVVIVEGEIDVMTIYQAGNCGAVTFGSMTAIPSAVTWREWLKNPDRICICLDADVHGEDGAKKMYAEIRRLENIRPVGKDAVYIRQMPKPVGVDKVDWNGLYTAGSDITELLDTFFPL